MSKKLTTLAVFGVLVILGLITDKHSEPTTTEAASATRTEPTTTQAKTTPATTGTDKHPVGFFLEEAKERNVRIDKWSWEKGGFDAIMLADLTIKNDNDTAVKDMAIECHTSGPSGTQLSTLHKTLYEIIPAHKAKRFRKINMGFMNQQSSNADCSLEGAVEMAAE